MDLLINLLVKKAYIFQMCKPLQLYTFSKVIVTNFILKGAWKVSQKHFEYLKFNFISQFHKWNNI